MYNSEDLQKIAQQLFLIENEITSCRELFQEQPFNKFVEFAPGEFISLKQIHRIKMSGPDGYCSLISENDGFNVVMDRHIIENLLTAIGMDVFQIEEWMDTFFPPKIKNNITNLEEK